MPTRFATSNAKLPITTGVIVILRSFLTETGDALPLDVADQFAARIARDGDPEPIHLEETDTTFAIRPWGSDDNSTVVGG